MEMVLGYNPPKINAIFKFTTTRANKYCSNSLLDNQHKIKCQILQFILNSGLHQAKVEKNILAHI